MAGKKSAAVLIAVAVIFGMELTKIYIPEGFERPNLYKASVAMIRASGYLAKTGASLNYGTEISNFRNILNLAAVGLKSFASDTTDPDVNIAYKLLANVPVRVYTPKSSSNNEANRPIMIFYHGGGYVFGTTDSYDSFLFDFVKKLNMVIISVDYRMGPEHPYPIPTADCYAVTKYVIYSGKEFGADLSRLVLAGDSAGGNAVAVITQRLLQEKLPSPKIQVLIYPWVQLFNNHLPSALEYQRSGIIGTTMSIPKLSAMYMGVNQVTDEIENALISNNHTALITDKKLKEKIKSYMDIDQIPDKYKQGKKYYNSYALHKNLMFPDHLDESNILMKNQNLANMLKKLVDPSVSPLFADQQKLIGLPKAYFVVFEWDSLKDEGLLYAERLKKAGVKVETTFYEKAFHGIVNFCDENIGYKVAREVRQDLVKYLKSNL